MHKIFFYGKFITRLYMFRAPCAHHQEVKLYYTASGIVTPVGGRPVRRLREEYNFDLLMMSTTVLKTCRGI